MHVCILNWNTHHDTLRCIRALTGQHYSNAQIVVVDNGSSLESLAALRSSDLPFSLISNRTNSGFTGGCNAVIRYAVERGTEYVWLLNSDALVEADTLQLLVETAEANPSVGILSPVVYSDCEPRQIQSCGMRVNLKSGGFEYFQDTKNALDCQARTPQQFCVWGTAMLIRRSAIDRVGLFDERFFAYCEDVDYCVRTLAAGFEIRLVPETGVLHGPPRPAKSSSPPPAHRSFYMARNSILFWMKHMTGLDRFKYVYWSIVSSTRMVLQFQTNSAVRDACLDGIWCGLMRRTGGWTIDNDELKAPNVLKTIFLFSLDPLRTRRQTSVRFNAKPDVLLETQQLAVTPGPRATALDSRLLKPLISAIGGARSVTPSQTAQTCAVKTATLGFSALLRNNLALSLPPLAARLLSLILIPIYTHYLSPADFGMLELLDLTLYFFTALSGAQLSSAILYFHKNSPHEDRVFNAGLLWGAFIGITVAATGCLLAGRISLAVFQSRAFTIPLTWYFVAFACGPMIEAGLVILRIKDKIQLFNLGLLSKTIFQAALNVLFLLVFRTSYMSFVWSSLITSAAFGGIVLFCFYRKFSLTLDRSIFLGIARYSMPLGLGALMMLTVHYGDRYFLQRLVSLSEVGVYSLSYKIGMLTYFVYGPFALYWSVERFRIADMEHSKRFYVKVFTYLVLVMGVTFLSLTLFSGVALAFMVPSAYLGAAYLVPWISMAYVLRVLGEHLRSVLMVHARTLVDTRISLAGGALCVICYAILIPIFGAAGAAAATLVAFAVMALCSLVAAQRVQFYHFETRRIGQIVIAVALSVVPGLAVANETLWSQVLGGLGGLTAFPTVLYFMGFLEASEKEWFQGLLSVDCARRRFRN